jgi:demethylmacrocin O-methyltransferase
VEPPPIRLSLDAIAVRHGSDKSSRVHGYTRAYERYFAAWKDDTVRLLEIGIGGGSSLRMWREYFPSARLYGLDVKDCRHVESVGVTVFVGSQADAGVLDRVAAEAGKLDIIIDDGSHRWSDQVFAFQKLYPHLKPGGYYVVEDLHTSYSDDYRSGDERALAFFQGLAQDVNLHGKSGYGRPCNDPYYSVLIGELNVYERTIESLTFYKSIVFVRKKGADEI